MLHRNPPRVALTLLLLLTLVTSLAPAPAGALPTPGLFCDEAKEATGRYFPEAMETNDFVSYDEARCGLDRLENEHPQLLEVKVLGPSQGWMNHRTGQHDTFDVFAVEVTNEASPVPYESKLKVAFMLSIHGNEKGGREGGLRVIEDLATGQGIAEENPRLVEMLDHVVAVFLFPNPDGWTHEMTEYRANDACYTSLTCEYGSAEDDNGGENAGEVGAETQSFVRVNGNGVDLNRDSPTVGWYSEEHTALSEPESRAYVPYLMGLTNLRYASDIHGMLNPADGRPPVCAPSFFTLGEGTDPCLMQDARAGHFVLTMLPAAEMTPEEMRRSTRLAETIKQRLNGNDAFVEWNTAPEAYAWGGEFNEWGTVWDTIGYTDSGFSSDFFAQDQGLDVPGVDFELAYNHITFDNYYPGVAQRINAYHVESVRVIVEAFMEATVDRVDVTLDDGGTRTLVVENPRVVTNADDRAPLAGWAMENDHDDAYDIAHRTVEARPHEYFDVLQGAASDPDAIASVPASALTAQGLEGVDNVVVAGSAYEALREDPQSIAAIRDWVRGGGNLLVTDSALQLLVDLGVTSSGGVDVTYLYAGYTNFEDRDHELVRDVRGLARQTYEPVPLGFSVHGNHAPVWYVDRGSFDGEVVGVAGAGQDAEPDPSKVNLGRAALGEGSVTFLGALLPDPTEDFYHPYGLDGYATTYTGNQLVRNALGWKLTETVTEVEVDADGNVRPLEKADADAEDVASAEGAGDAGVPGFGTGLAMAAALGAAVLVARRRELTR